MALAKAKKPMGLTSPLPLEWEDDAGVFTKRALAKRFGFIAAGVLCQIMYWTEKGKVDSGGWVYLPQERLYEQTGITRREQERARLKLRAAGVLEEERRGAGGVLHFRVVYEALDDRQPDITRSPTNPPLSSTNPPKSSTNPPLSPYRDSEEDSEEDSLKASKASVIPINRKPSVEDDEIAAALKLIGISENGIKNIRRDFHDPYIIEKLRVVSTRISNGESIKNAAGYLTQALTHDYAMPKKRDAIRRTARY